MVAAPQSGVDEFISEPDWSRPIWLTQYDPASTTEERFTAGQILRWSAQPLTQSEISDQYQPNDPVLFCRAVRGADRGGITATAKARNWSGQSETPTVELEITYSLLDKPISRNLVLGVLDTPVNWTAQDALKRLDSLQT